MQYLYLRERELVLSYDGKFYPHLQFFINANGDLERKPINQIIDENEELQLKIKELLSKITPIIFDIDMATKLNFALARYDFDIVHLNVDEITDTSIGKFPRMMLVKLLEREHVFKSKKERKSVEQAKAYPLTELIKVNKAHKAQCPFQLKDKTPSLHVYPNNTWYCFSCNQGGDVIDFVMKKHGLDFMSAVNKINGK